VSHIQSSRRIDYAGSVHDEREIEAVIAVLRGGPTALRVGPNVKAMEAQVAALLGKRRGVMCNSGSSALYAGSGIRRSDLQQWMEDHGVDTRMVWTGNAARQPAFRDQPRRTPADGLPNADQVMEWGLILPNNHSMTDEDCAWIGECLAGFVTGRGLA